MDVNRKRFINIRDFWGVTLPLDLTFVAARSILITSRQIKTIKKNMGLVHGLSVVFSILTVGE